MDTCVRVLREFYGTDPKSNEKFGRIVSAMHCERLQGLLNDKPGNIVVGGNVTYICVCISVCMNIIKCIRFFKIELHFYILYYYNVNTYV